MPFQIQLSEVIQETKAHCKQARWRQWEEWLGKHIKFMAKTPRYKKQIYTEPIN
jgi:hypothetical protein